MPIVYLTRRATFCASHRLHSDGMSAEDNRRIYGKCNNLNGHGHNYVLEVTVHGEVDPRTGMVINLTDLKHLIDEHIIGELDHKHLNLDVPMLAGLNPTAENITLCIWERLSSALPPGLLYEVKLHETENNVVIYRGE